jgi:hypothetical protein
MANEKYWKACNEKMVFVCVCVCVCVVGPVSHCVALCCCVGLGGNYGL